MNQGSRAATENFVFLKAANNGSLKPDCCFESAMECTGKKIGLPQGRKKASLKFGLLG